MTEIKRPLRVFLCHSSADKPAVEKLFKHLVNNGIDAWLDKEKLIPGQDWQVEIPKAVKNSDVVIVCLTSQSITKEGFVQKEIKIALDTADEKPDGTIFVIPARLEQCEVPERISRFQWVDLFSDNGHELLLKALQIRADNLGITLKQHKEKTVRHTSEENPIAYTTRVTYESPAHLLYLIDCSGSMSTILEGKPRHSWIEEGLEYVLNKILDRSYANGVYYSKYKIAIIAYSSGISFPTEAKFIDAKDLLEAGIPQFVPGGETGVALAFEEAYRLLNNLLQEPIVKHASPAPLLCHITDGTYNVGGSPEKAIQKLKTLRNKDGNVLVQNLLISDNLLYTPITNMYSWVGLKSSDERVFKNSYEPFLLSSSSALPSAYANKLKEYGYSLEPDSKMMYPAENSELIKLSFLVTISAPFS